MQAIVIALACACLAAAKYAQGDGIKGREAVKGMVEDARSAVPSPARVELEAHEAALDLPFEAVRFEGVRVLSTSGIAEADEVARLMAASRSLFHALTGREAAFPYACTVFLLREQDRDPFLDRHPRIDAETRAWMEKKEGAGVPKTADWAFWVQSAEKRREWSVRFAFDWLMREAFKVTNEQHAWLHESMGLYLSEALAGTHSTWFVQPKKLARTAELGLQMGEPFARWLDLAIPLFGKDQKFDFEEILHLQPGEFDLRDHLRSYALLARVIETRREALPDLLTRIGAGDDARGVLEEVTGKSLAALRTEIAGWLEERATLLAKAEGRYADAELTSLWKALDAPAQALAIEAFQNRLGALESDQMRRLRALLALAPEAIPVAEETLPFFDPKVHAPAQPIPRKRLRPTDSRAKKLVEAARARSESSPVVRSYDYEWGTHRIVRVGVPLEPEAVFQNALLGLPPDADLARAVLLSLFDRDDERKLHSAFSHAYTDRKGNVFPVSLYDVWSAGIQKEMPDVDTLGLVHELLDDWKRWVAPIPDTQHGTMYDLLDRLSKQCIRSRQLREFTSDLYLSPDPSPPEGYESLVFNLHAQWALMGDDPERMAAALPPGKDRDEFLEALTKRCLEDGELYVGGRRRGAVMRMDVVALRKTLATSLLP